MKDHSPRQLRKGARTLQDRMFFRLSEIERRVKFGLKHTDDIISVEMVLGLVLGEVQALRLLLHVDYEVITEDTSRQRVESQPSELMAALVDLDRRLRAIEQHDASDDPEEPEEPPLHVLRRRRS